MGSAAGRPLRNAAKLPASLALVLLMSAVPVPPAARADTTQAARPQAAAEEGFALTYDVYEGGFRALRFELEVGLGGDTGGKTYRTEMRARTSGIIGFFFEWRLSGLSEGRWLGDGPAPARYRTANVWRGRERRVEVTWRDGTPVEVAANPPYGKDDRAAVDPAQLPGTVDPMSAVTAMILSGRRQGAEAGPCRPRTRVYDGRRRYDVILSPLGRRAIGRSPFAPFEGEAEGCRLAVERVAGFEEGSDRMKDLGADVWLADVGTGGRVPVRLRLETGWGTGFAHLVRARRADGRLVFGEPGEE